jgi:hypothetical protein
MGLFSGAKIPSVEIEARLELVGRAGRAVVAAVRAVVAVEGGG